MKIRLTSLEQTYVPNITFTDDKNIKFKNRELPDDEQVKIVLKLANADQKVSYQSGYTTFDKKSKMAKVFNPANTGSIVGKHVIEVKGLESFGITTGISLVENHKKYDEISEIVLECYNVIMGAWPVDYDAESQVVSEEESLPGE